MVKRFLGILLVIMLLTGSAFAAVLTDAPGTPTQDRAVFLKAEWLDDARTEYELDRLPTDQLTMDTVTDIYDFVYEKGNRPVRWYPEKTQHEIEAMVSVDPDSLYMTEFMRLHAADAEPQADLSAVMQLEIDYQVGQLTVVVLGDTTDPENIEWTPVDSHVTAVGVVVFEVPQSLMEQLYGEDLLFSLLTIRQGPTQHKEVTPTEVPEIRPSKTAEDNTRIIETVTEDGTARPDDFELVIVSETDIIKREISLLQQYVTEQKQPALSWLPEEDQNRVRYLLGTNTDDLIVTDYVPLITRDYRATDGDAVGSIAFATPYEEGQKIVTALGIPKNEADAAAVNDETQMNWSVQPAVVREGGWVDIVFDQLALIGMETDTGLLLMLSVPAAE